MMARLVQLGSELTGQLELLALLALMGLQAQQELLALMELLGLPG